MLINFCLVSEVLGKKFLSLGEVVFCHVQRTILGIDMVYKILRYPFVRIREKTIVSLVDLCFLSGDKGDVVIDEFVAINCQCAFPPNVCYVFWRSWSVCDAHYITKLVGRQAVFLKKI